MARETRLKHLWWVLLAAVLPVFLVAFGCGGTTPRSAYFSNYHGVDWVSTHPGPAIAAINDCKACHETTVLKQGGPAPSCMTAITNPNPTSWMAPSTGHGPRLRPGPRAGV
jgi:hypothetical protein